MNVLFVTSNRIGDAILSTGLVAYMVDTYPGLRLTVACGPLAAPLFTATPGLERVISIAKAPYGSHWVRLWRETILRRWSAVVDLRGSLLAYCLVTPRRRVFSSGLQTVHKVAQLAGFLGISPPPSPRIYLNADHRAAAAQLIPGDGPVLALGPTANWGGKVWPAERFAATVVQLTGPNGILPGARVALFGGPGEEAMAAPLRDAIPAESCIDLIGRVDLPTASACMARTAMFIGNDSAPMHLAAATGTPTLGLFGPSKEAVYGPWGPNGAAVRTDLSYDEIVGAPGYDYRSHETRMGSLAVDKVVAATVALWRRTRPE